MDREELKKALKPFHEKCAEKGRVIKDLCVGEAFPGDESTSFIVQVTAPWVDDMACNEALDFLFDVLWETTTEDIRKKVFSIQVLDSREVLHCYMKADDK
jgi:hypothetical protein